MRLVLARVFNNTFPSDDTFTKAINDIISDYKRHKTSFSGAKELWEILKQDLSSFSRGYSSKKSGRERKDYELLKEKIEILEAVPKEDVSEYVKEALTGLKEQEKAFLTKKMNGSILRSKMPHIEPSEKDIAYYARLEKISGEKNLIYCLMDSNDILKQGTKNVMEIVYDFYSNLYKKEPECEVTQDLFLSKVSVRLSEDEKNKLDEDFTPEELSKSVSSLKNNKSPGEDGLTKEFFNYFWENLVDLYLECLDECESTGELCDSQKKGLVRISYKKLERILIKNYRPITLLNVDLKILTRTLAIRALQILHKLIHRDQTCVPGRNILNNMHIVQDLIDVITFEGKGAAFILVDEEKAFDRMSIKFILKTLKQFGFGDRFINWVRIIYTDISSAVKINGFQTKSFSIERGVRQGCPLSAILYVLCAEVLAAEIRSNSKIVGYKFNKGKNEHKLNAYADDKTVCVTTKPSIHELFKVFHRYEVATNARVNKDKTVGLWVGTLRGEPLDFAGIKWVEEPVKNVGGYVGNNRSECNVKMFEEVKEKIKTKLVFWAGKYISLKGRVKVLNIFALSKLWYVLGAQDIPNNLHKDFNNLITDFIWKDIHQVQLSVLHESYETGGLNLQDIELKRKALRVNWIKHLILCKESDIEKHLSNILIGKHKKIVGLKILNASNRYDKDIPCEFYKEAVKAWRIIFHSYIPKNVNDIKRDWIYDNVLLKDDDGRIFKPPSNFPPYAPEFFYDLPVTDNPREFRGVYRNLIPKLNRSFFKLSFSNNDKATYYITTSMGIKDVTLCNFSTLYSALLSQRKVSAKPWIAKWEQEGAINNSDWIFVWSNVHHSIISQTVQSSLWELLHRNYMCSYFSKLAFGGDGKCKLCGLEELERTHIFVSCPVINSIYDHFTPLLNSFCPDQMTLKEKIMGKKLESNKDILGILRNYVTSSIKHVVYRNRNNTFTNAVTSLIKLVKTHMKKDLTYQWWLASNNGRKDDFKNLYFQNNLLGSVCTNDSLSFSFTNI